MRKLHKTNKRAGRVRIDLASAESGTIQVTIARACDNPTMLRLVDDILDEIVRRHPQVHIDEIEPKALLPGTSRRRGGPVGTPRDLRLEIVKGWLDVQGRMKETIYAKRNGISAATLRRWTRELRQEGKL